MSKKDNTLDFTGETILQREMQDVLHESMISYAEYVLLDRALPDVRDGLKPVQRRILYTMHELSLSPDKPHRKCARIVGDALGKYHPHGDSSVYEALVRMGQPFNMRLPLVDGQGNFGSIDGDSAAAMRYTEARLKDAALQMLRDIEKDTVSFHLNFDDTLKEPDVLPARFPNLLVNGASGIAVGLATNIPPHNPGEAIDAVIAQMDNPDITLDDLMQLMPGPDFPTGGVLVGKEAIKEAYETGRGRLIVRANCRVEKSSTGRNTIVIDEMPFLVKKAALLEKILKVSEEKKNFLSGIYDVRDESDREGMRAVIELKKDADPDKILQFLYRTTDLQVTFGVNMVAIVSGKPVQVTLKEMLTAYIDHQREVVSRRCQFELEEAQKRAHILEGYIIAVDNIDAVIKIIRAAKNVPEAREKLMSTFNLTQIQAQAVLDMPLKRLTALEITTLKEEHAALIARIEELQAILASHRKLMNLIKKELLEIRKSLASPRRTKLIEQKPIIEKFKEEEAMSLPPEPCVVSISRAGYAKRIAMKSFQRSAREGDDDQSEAPQYLIQTMTSERLLALTSKGNAAWVNVVDLPDAKWRDRGGPFASFCGGFDKGETLVALFSQEDLAKDAQLVFFTQMGMVKRTAAEELMTRKSRIQGVGLKDGDALLGVEIANASQSMLMVTQKGMSIRFTLDEVPVTGRTAGGVKGIALDKGDSVLFAAQVDDEGELVLITDRGYGKRSLMVDYDMQGRNGKGLKTFDFKKNGANGNLLASVMLVKEPYDIIITLKNGETTRMNTEAILIEPRFSTGRALCLALMDNLVTRAVQAL